MKELVRNGTYESCATTVMKAAVDKLKRKNIIAKHGSLLPDATECFVEP